MERSERAPLETDYLIVGAGLSGLAFADTLVAESDADVTLVERQPAPGGHWLNAYPFVRLHSPSAYYGVNSLQLGEDRIDETGENAGFYERATGEQIRNYFDEAASRLSQTGRARILTEHEHLGPQIGDEQVRELRTGTIHPVKVRRRVVDARYLESSIPATHTPSFDVAADARFIPVNDLPASAQPNLSYTVLGSGKTAVDACMWLLDNDVPPDRIRWVRPRDAWFHDRVHFQPLELVGDLMAGISLDAEAGAQAADLDEMFDRLEASGRLSRIDPSYPATMYRGTMLSARELGALRAIENVVRLGRVRRLEADRIILEEGEIESGPDVLHVNCTALGVSNAPAVPVFQPERIVLQEVRHNSPPFNAALIAFVEAHRDTAEEKNRLCPPKPHPSRPRRRPPMLSRTFKTEQLWVGEPDLAGWIAGSRLNLLRALPDHLGEPAVQEAVSRFVTHVDTAIEQLDRMDAGGAQPPATPASRSRQR